MIRKIFSVITFQMIIFGSLTAQNFVNKINPYPNNSPLILNSSDTLRILAVMVEFQQDNDPTTFGNGKFGSIYTKDYGNSIIDPLPFNKAYFENHLKFAQNYYRKASNQNVNIKYAVLPEVITVSKTMRNYSPEVQSSDLSNVANLAQEVWQSADQLNYDFSNYDLFAIFHAGVGRDISLPGSIGNERDIPSVYLSENSLKNIFGNSFSGFNSNGKSILNTMVLPSTESRELEGIGGSVLIELSINGLIVASIASHLGLPDLFDTETGKSAIGRFGLMDGQSIFTYGGLFPPEPSAWEKIYLGWSTPIEISPGFFPELQNSGTLNFKLASSLVNSNDPKIYKIPLNDSEYYLVENRQRDVNANGSIITYVLDDQVKTISFTDDTTGFESFDIEALQGVVTDVDEYDWALPGNGILIWHIDENVINEKLASNSINTDKFRRGVDLEEADGIQDIGEEFTTIFGDIIIGEGSDQDLWYEGNKADLYKNKFDSKSKPSTSTNDGAKSLISFSNFSSSSNVMDFNLTFSQDNVQLIYDGNYQHDLVFSVNQNEIYGLKNSKLYAVPISQMLPTVFVDIDNFSNEKPASLIKNGDKYIFGVFNNILNVYKVGEGSLLKSQVLDAVSNKVPVIANSNGDDIVFIINENNQVESYIFDPASADILLKQNNFNANQTVEQVLYLNGLFVSAGNSLLSENIKVGQHSFNSNVKYFSAYINNNSDVVTIVLLENNSFVALKNNQIVSEFSFSNSGTINSFVVADLNSSGENQILFTSDNTLYAVSLDGASIDNLPFKASNPLSEFINVIDLQNDGYAEILFYDSQGNIYLISAKDGKINSDFPVSIGQSLKQNPILYDNNGNPSLFILGKNGAYRVFKMNYPNNFTILYAEDYGSSGNNLVYTFAKNTKMITDYFPSAKAYNWPNPVYENETFIRFYVSDDSNAEIKIFDLSGDLVDELSGFAIGGVENEITWNVQNIQSGVYFAHLEVKSSNGKSANKIIKIAVIK